ncbi:MAG: branched-chain amino acid ABC transporter permease [Desulfovibrionaceae bacterium]|nr:branched-chain amino acid ABC transporter permease [Desulfovibrionaceae bacterium]
MRRALPGALSPVLFFAAAMAAPFVLSNQYYVSVMTLCAINALIVLGLNLLLGFAGQISLGHAAFFGIGAYASAILTTTYAWPIWAGMLAGVCLAAAVAWLIGVPALKLHGHYLAVAAPSLVWIARSARPVREAIRLRESATASASVPAHKK